MNTNLTQKINGENAKNVIARLIKGGREVDEHRAMIIFRNLFENKEYEANYVDDVCEMFCSTIWNYGLVK